MATIFVDLGDDWRVKVGDLNNGGNEEMSWGKVHAGLQKSHRKVKVVVHSCHPRLWETRAGGS